MRRRTLRWWFRRARGHVSASRTAAPDLDNLAHTWDVLGQRDPLWAVLTRPGTRGGRWDPEEFFEDGQMQVDGALGLIEDDIGWPLHEGRALDFGCGVGRLSQALCTRFERVDGVDIAPSMVKEAERFNRFGDRCRYHLNVRDDLALFDDGSFDLIYSTYVLQHMHPTFARRYVEEFVRLLSPRGLALFQMPTAKRVPPRNDPMPDAWFVADQMLLEPLPSEVSAGDDVTVRVRVVNRSAGVWPAKGKRAVRLGGRWRRGGSVVGPEVRCDLAANLSPGDDTTLEVSLEAPRDPGILQLECGLLQEGVAWFVDKGGPLVRADVDVVAASGGPDADPATGDDEDPPMEMHATPVEEVTRWVSAAGGQVVRVIDAPPDEDYDGVLYAVAREGSDVHVPRPDGSKATGSKGS